MISRSALISLIPLAALTVSGCGPTVLLSGGTMVGVAASQERTIGSAVDDAVIAAAVVSNFYQFDVELLRRVSAEVVEGRVLLIGSVPKPENRVDAVRLTWQVNGVIEVFNEIQVTDKGGLIDIVQDAWISARLHTKLLLDEKIRALNYNIETVNGVIYIIGIARNASELERVTNHGRIISGVRKVISHVRVLGAS